MVSVDDGDMLIHFKTLSGIIPTVRAFPEDLIGTIKLKFQLLSGNCRL